MDPAERDRLLKLCAEKCNELRKSLKFETHYYRKNNPSEENKYDFFPSSNKSDKLVIFVHGGRWIWGDLTLSSFPAEFFVPNNINFAAIGFDYCPKVSVTEMICQVRQAIKVILENHPDQKHVYLLGHSSGAHHALAALVCDWFEDDLAFTPSEKERLAGAVLMSGTYDMTNLSHSELNEKLKLTPTETLKTSPINFVKNMCFCLKNNFKVFISVEEGQTGDYNRQAQILYKELKQLVNEDRVSLTIVQGVNHITSLTHLGQKDYDLTDKVLKFLNE